MLFLKRIPHKTRRFLNLSPAEKHGFLVALVLEPFARASVRMLGYRRGLRSTHRLGRLLRNASFHGQSDDLQHGHQLALRSLPGSGSCLTRSVSLFSLLRAHEHVVKLQVGVSASPGAKTTDAPEPPGAHAWVELDGAALGRDGQSVKQYRLLGTLAG
jgi:hypothetical protein